MNTLFFYLSKIVWMLLSPASLIYLLLAAGIVLFFLNKTRPAKLFLGAGGILLTLAAFLPLGSWLATPLETRFSANPDLPRRVDGIIMLGGAIDPVASYIWDQPEFGSAGERYTALVGLAKEYPRAKLVVTGGAGTLRDQEYKEADVAVYFLENLGINKRRLEVERDSRNTYENAVNTMALMEPETDENWVLITSAAHMPRAVGVFCKQGWTVIPYPVDHDSAPGIQNRITFDPAGNLSSLNDSSKEWIGLLVYYITGKTTGLVPSGCRMGN